MYLLLLCSPSKSPTHFWPQLSYTQWSHPGAAGGPNTPTYRQGNSKTDETAATKSAEKGSIACMQQFGPWCHLLWDKCSVYGMYAYSKISWVQNKVRPFTLNWNWKRWSWEIKTTKVCDILPIIIWCKMLTNNICSLTMSSWHVMATKEVLWSAFLLVFKLRKRHRFDLRVISNWFTSTGLYFQKPFKSVRARMPQF